MTKMLLAAVAAVAIAGCVPAHAADITAIAGGCRGKDAGDKSCYDIRLDGEIVAADDVKFERIVKRNKIRKAVVTLNSMGGDMFAGIGIGAFIFKHGFGTYVPAGNHCASMCASIWLAGTNRYVSLHSSIGFHTIWVAGRRGKPVRSPDGNAWMSDYYTKLGFKRNAIRWMLEANPDRINWLTAGISAKYGIVDEVVDVPASRAAAEAAG